MKLGAWRGCWVGLWLALSVVAGATSHEEEPRPQEHTPDDRKPHHRLAVYRHARARRVVGPTTTSELATTTQMDTVVGLLKHYTNASTTQPSDTSLTSDPKAPESQELLPQSRGQSRTRNATSVSIGANVTSSNTLRRRSPPTETCEAGPPLTKQRDASADDNVIDVAVIVPCNASHQYSRVKVLPVVELAVRHLRETGLRGPLQNYTINVRYRDSRTSSTYGPLAAVDLYLNNSADVFLGPVDDYVLAPMARFSGAWNVPLLTPGGQPSAFDTRKDYPLLTRLKGFYTEVGQLFSRVVKHWGWNVLGLIYEEKDDEKGHSVCYFTVASIYSTFNNKPHFEKFRENSNRNFTQLLMSFHDKARILVVCGSPANVRGIMLAAAGLNMVATGDYAFFNIEIFTGTAANYKPWYNASDTDERNEIAKKAYEAVLTVTARAPSSDQYKNFSSHVSTLGVCG